MFRRRFFAGFLVTALVLVLLAIGGYALLQTGISQGYALGLQAAGSEAAPEVLPFAAPLYRYPPYHGFGFGIGRMLLILFFIFVGVRLLFLPWMFRRSRWGYSGPHGGHPSSWGPPPWARKEAEGGRSQEADPPEAAA